MRVRRSMIGARIGLAALAASMALVTWGQGFNIDIDDPYSPPQGGGGAPSDFFGGAVSQAGHWNKITGEGPPVQLDGLDGLSTSVVCTGPIGGIGGGNNFAGNTGDYALLLNDGNLVAGDSRSWQIDGLVAGLYQVAVYAVRPDDLYNPTPVTVTASGWSSTLYVTGPMPGNQFDLGITHQLFSVDVSGGPLVITVGPGEFYAGWMNGFQIVPVPEPTAVVPLAGGVCLLLSRRRRKKRFAA